jgi:tetratricopeptide (TPR) repeat protein
MRVLNVRLLTILVVSGLALGVALFGLHYVQNRRHASFFLDKARGMSESEDVGERAQAVKYFRNYIGLTDDIDAKQELGMLLADLGPYNPVDYANAFQLLEGVLREDGSRDEVRRKLVEIAMFRLHRHADALDHLKVLRETSPKDPELLELLGQCQTARGEDVEAEKSLEAAIEYGPGRITTYELLSRLLRFRLKREKDADAWMDKMVEQNPNSAQAYLTRGQYLWRTGRPEEAELDAAKALELSPDDRDALMLSAECELDKEQYEKARRHAQRVVELFPKGVPAYELLSRIEMRAKNPEEARAWIDKGLEATDRHVQLLWNKANYVLDSGDVDKAEKTVDELDSGKYPSARVKHLRARIAYYRRKWDESRRGFEEIRDEMRRWPGLLRQGYLLTAECHRRLDRPELQQECLERAREINPGWSPARVAAAQAMVNRGELIPAIREYQQIMKLEDAPASGWLQLTRLLMLKNAYSRESERDWGEVEAVLATAGKAMPGSPQVLLLRAELFVAQDRRLQAEKLLQRARDEFPDDWRFINMLFKLALMDEDWQQAERLLSEAEQAVGDGLALRLARANLLLQRDKDKAVESLGKLAGGTDAFSDNERLALWRTIAIMLFRAGAQDKAMQLARRVADEQPENLHIRQMLMEWAVQVEDDAVLKKVLEEIGKIENNGPLWHFGQAVRLAIKGDKTNDKSYDEAIRHLAQARVLRPSWARVPAMLGKIYDHKEETDLAIENYTQAIDQGSRDVVAMNRLAQLLFEKGRDEEAHRILGLLGDRALSPRLKLEQAGLALREGKFDEGLEYVRQVAEKSKDYRDHLRLGRITGALALRARKQRKTDEAEQLLREAEQALRHAAELDPEAVDPWISLVRLLYTTERAAEAEDVLAEAKKKVAPEKQSLLLAHCYEAMGRLTAAEKQLRTALEEESTDGTVTKSLITKSLVQFYLRTRQWEKAVNLLRNAIKGKQHVTDEDVIWARRRLATTVFARGDFQSRQEALALINQNLAVENPSIYDRRIKTRLLVAFATRQQREEAISMLNDMLEGPQPLADDRFVLAKLLWADEQWSKATALMRDHLLSVEDVRPEWLEFHVKALIQQGEYGGAESYLRQLEQLVPDQFAIANLRAQMLAGRGRVDQAIRGLKAFLDNPQAEPVSKSRRLRLVGKALERLGMKRRGRHPEQTAAKFNNEAEAVYRQYVKERPEHAMLLVGFLGRQGKLDEALDLAEREWRKGQPIPIASTSVSLLLNTKATPKHAERVEKLLDDALDKYGNAVSLRLALAELRAVQKRYEEAEAIYRKIIVEEPENIVALNNLAVFLALRGLKLDNSLDLVNRSIEIAGPIGTLLDSRASVHMARGEPDKALEDLKAAIDDEPTASRYFHRAMAYHKKKDQQAAVAALRKAHELGLKVDQLQPLERPVYRTLVEELK